MRRDEQRGEEYQRCELGGGWSSAATCSLYLVHGKIRWAQEIVSGHGSGNRPSRLASLSNLCPSSTAEEEEADRQGIHPSAPTAGRGFGRVIQSGHP